MLQTLKTPGDTRWFVHDRFGMFIHWGLYSMPARHEWVRHNEKIPTEVYDRSTSSASTRTSTTRTLGRRRPPMPA